MVQIIVFSESCYKHFKYMMSKVSPLYANVIIAFRLYVRAVPWATPLACKH